jgi:hypothetical protein
MKNTRRRFIRSASLTATSLVLIRPGVEAYKSNSRRTAIGCAPQKQFALTGTISSVQSGKWSDPLTWGGKTPSASDTPLISPGHTIVYDVTLTTVAGINVSSSAVLSFDTAKSTTLQSTANVVIEGKLEMHPATAAVIQILRFMGVDESKFVGGGMDVLATDVGLWVMGAGMLDLAGTAKSSWTRVSGSIGAGATSISVENANGWLPGDEISITPTEAPTVGDAFATGFDARTINSVSGNTITLSSGTSRPHPVVNNQWTAEVINLTRNVRIEGTAAGKAHIYIRSTSIQKVQYAAMQYMGPRKDRGGSTATELVAGRYGLHFHHCMDGSRGSLVQGNVVRDTDNHSYVPHVSHGIKFLDNVAYNVTETAFWWDPGDPTHDVIYDHNLVAITKFINGSLNMNAQDAPTFSSSGFALNTGDGNIAKNNVVVAGSQGDHAEGGAYNWEAVINEGVWIFTNNLAHNCGCGLRVWQNSTRNHVIEDFTSYHNNWGMFHGAYANSYTYNGGTFYGCGIEIKAASANTNRVRLENITIDGAGIIDYGIQIIHSPLPGNKPVFLRNLTIRGCKVAAILDAAAPEVHSTDVIQCNIDGAIVLDPNAADGETIRIQPVTGQSTQISKTSKGSSIAPFAATIWGNGKGLKGEYFNSANFTNPALTRIDSNVSFTEWSAGVHYAITGSTYSVRWTGQLQAQYSESHTFYLGSGGGHRLWIDNKLILDSWVEHYPDSFQSSPITLVAGQRYDVKLEYFNTEGGTGMGLLWTSPSLPLEYVPQSQLYTDAISAVPANQGPVANAGKDILLTLPVNSTTLDGSASADADGSIASYAWTKLSGPAQFTIASPAAVNTALTNLVEGVYVFRLKVTDNKGASGEDDVTVTVSAAANQSPVANAGKDIVLTLPANSTTLDGSASADPDGSLASYAWTLQSGPAQFTIASPAAVTTALTNLVEGTYVFRLKVTDNKGATHEDDVAVTVSATANQSPVANAGKDIALTLPVNSTTLDGSASADPDGSIASYVWTKLSGPAQFTIINTTAVTTQLTNLVAGTYIFRLKVTDNKGATHEDDLTVIVSAAANKAPVANAGSDIVISLPVNSAVLNGSGSGDADGKIASYTWTKVSGPSQYAINNANAISPVLSNLVAGDYIFRLRVMDDQGAIAEDDVLVTVKALPVDGSTTLSVQAGPNPSTNYFTLQITGSTNYPVVIRIYNNRGGLVDRITRTGTNITITIGSSWRPGTYYAFIDQGYVRRTVTLIKL